ncbi:MAG: hypothetical protein IKN38_04770, partial [Clostridia bacterium]|nr:hypothetical protein [Clostridia bacterium]
MERIPLNFGWEFVFEYTDEFLSGNVCQTENVDLPHTVATTPYDYFDESVYQTVSGYRKTVDVPADWAGKRVFIFVGAAAHKAEVFVNGELIYTHLCGYTAFRVELTDHIKPGGKFVVALKVDSRETLDVPPFGNVVDYMTYGGIYREVYIEVAEKTYIEDVFVTAHIPEGVRYEEGADVTFTGRITAKLKTDGDGADGVELTVGAKDGGILAQKVFPVSEELSLDVPAPGPWPPGDPRARRPGQNRPRTAPRPHARALQGRRLTPPR